MRKIEFQTLDVFTDKHFSGNPLAVFPDGSSVSEVEMQKIASELNLSETVFVLQSDNALRRLRIFTPTRELPLAGHPVVGTWNLLARLGVTPKTENGKIEIEQELKLGVLPVTLEFEDGEIATVEMQQGEFNLPREVVDPGIRSELAAALGLNESDIGNTRTDLIQAVSTGIGSLAVPVASMEALRRIQVSPDKLSRIYLESNAVGCYAFCFETIEQESLVHARFFAPADGIPEDPATGSAAGSLSGYLVHNGIITRPEFVIEQGDIMGRPGRIHARVDGEKGNVRAVYIKGTAVQVMKGAVSIP